MGAIALWCILIFLFIPTQLHAQETQYHPADAIFAEAIGMDERGDYRGAVEKYLAARKLYKKSGNWDEYFNAFSYYLNALDKLGETRHLASASRSFEFQIDSISTIYPSFNASRIRTSSDMFRFKSLIDQNRYQEAETVFEKLFRTINRTEEVQDSFSRMIVIQMHLIAADLYSEKGSYQRSIDYSLSALDFINRWQYDSLYEEQGATLKCPQIMAKAHMMLGENEKVGEDFALMLELLGKVDSKKGERIYGAYKQIFEYYLSRDEPEQAARYIKKLSELEYAQQRATDLLIFQSKYSAAFETADIASAKLEKARLSILRERNITHHSYLENRRLYLEGLLREHQYLKILEVIEEMERNLALEMVSTTQLPDFMDIRAIKAAALFALYEEGDLETLDLSWREIMLCIHQIQEIRRSHQSDSDKAEFLSRSYRIFEQALVYCHAQYFHKNDPTWVDSAFSLMEGSKALNLLEGLLHRNATDFAGVDQERIAAETDLRTQIAGLEVRLNSPENRLSDRVKEQIGARKLDLERTYDSLIVVIEEAHPEFYTLRHQTSTPQLEEINSQLNSENRAFVEFFLGEKELFTLAIFNGVKKLYRANWPSDGNELIARHLTSIREFYNPTALMEFKLTGFEIYKLTLGQIEFKLPERVTIVPDGVLNYISFAGLPSQQNEDIDILNLDYLIYNHAFSYAYSASMLMEVNRTHGTDHSLSAFAIAPSFVDEPLSYNEKEIDEIARLFKTEKLKGSEATKSHFLTSVQTETDKDILHLSTHGVANKKTGTESYLRFTQTNDAETPKLFAWELYNLRLPFSLCFLSACETSDGEMQKGEGIVSLAQGFFYAGVKSLVTTLWSIGDATSVETVTGFYKNLKKGEAKDVALRHAQLSYLKKMIKGRKKNECHPVHWAAFLAVGDMSPLTVRDSFGWLGDWRFWLVVCGVIGLALVLYLSRRVKSE